MASLENTLATLPKHNPSRIGAIGKHHKSTQSQPLLQEGGLGVTGDIVAARFSAALKALVPMESTAWAGARALAGRWAGTVPLAAQAGSAA